MKKLLTISALCLMAMGAWAVPANPRPVPYVQPNGDTLIIRLIGDEHFHYRTTEDGILIAKNKRDYYCYAKWREVVDADGRKWRTAIPYNCKKAHNEGARSKREVRWLKRKKMVE